jgi:hypothetical protein
MLVGSLFHQMRGVFGRLFSCIAFVILLWLTENSRPSYYLAMLEKDYQHLISTIPTGV